MASIIWSRHAEADFEAIFQFIARDAPQAAQNFAEELAIALAQLESFPESGRTVLELGEGIRQIIFGPYRLIYEVTDDHLEVRMHAIRHGAQRLRDIPGL